jgi:cytochrome c peroxidase
VRRTDRALALALATVAAAACGGAGSGGTARPTSGVDSDAGVQATVKFSAAETAALAALAPAQLPAPGPDISNQYADDPKVAAFGQKLFFEPRFSGELLDGDDDGSPQSLGVKGQAGAVACAGCHVASAGFLDNRTLGEQISLGAGWGRRRAPSLLDVGQAKLLMWDGRRDALYNQPFGPLESPVEMNSSRLYAAEKVFQLYRADYEALFGALPPLGDATRFPQLSSAKTGCQPSTADPIPTCNGTEHGMPGDGAEYDGMAAADQDAVNWVVVNVGKSLGAYERLLTCGPSRFDAWVRGQSDALSPSEQRGAQVFVGSGKCVNCHSGPYLSDQAFHNVGLMPTTVAVVFTDTNDPGARAGIAAAIADPLNVGGKYSDGNDGRLPAAVGASMAGAFRTPTLRCVSQRPSFMHTGQLSSLEQVVAFFAKGGDTFGYVGTSEITPLSLTAQDQQDLAAFLRALEGAGPAASLTANPTGDGGAPEAASPEAGAPEAGAPEARDQ